ncbi:MAG: DUF4416 family protein [Deltaproteobacteria bacterium]|nr:DUF4416 family protein [Deltaproteobacteria bacterium]
MSFPQKDIDRKLVVGVLYQKECHVQKKMIFEQCEAAFGHIEEQTDDFSFHHTAYYEEEMGPQLMRFWLAFENLHHVEDFVKVKHAAYEIENIWVEKGKRLVNVDPGFLSLHNFILLSFKDFSHRIPLGQGVYADLTLIFKGSNAFEKLPWTYADYQSDEFMGFLSKTRDNYKRQLRSEK